ncbi:hypothetical protein VE01_03662 [Pseudogymnoascus verrucosus]|uniref:Uncharacterized protein n=1 Tax=Pseudogymnoascus verrucosus TaxID=342668 RepID=A0A1B8GS07_9PEZI|nr:uncharacterized protein VE01_03662 [Pseudogymnoascus verrucosus]OBT98618.1 hypothetical protein VE01_03662 [Pseudogymnoascus verrucosus]
MKEQTKEQTKERTKRQTKEQTKNQTSEERRPSDLGRLVEETRLAEDDSTIQERKLSVARRWAERLSEDGGGPEDPGGGSPTDDDERPISLIDLEATELPRTTKKRHVTEEFSMTPDGMAEAEEELAEEERHVTEEFSVTTVGMLEAEEELAEEERHVTEEFSVTTVGMLEAEEDLANTETSWSIDWTVTSSELAELKKEEAERMAKEDREIAEEHTIQLAMEDDYYNTTVRTYDLILQGYCNDILYAAVWREQEWPQGPLYSSILAPVRKENAMEAGVGNTDARDKKAIEAPADGGAAGVPVAAPAGNDKPLPMAGVLESDRRGAMDTGTVTIPTKLVPRTDYDKVLLGMEDVAFIQEVADACTENVERRMEGGKIYLAVKAAMGDECVGTYQCISGQMGLVITNFIICFVGAVLNPLQKEQHEIKLERKLASTQAWIKESGAALATLWPGDVLGPTAWPEDAQALTGGGLEVDDFGGLNDAQTPLPTLDTPDISQPSNRRRGTGRASRSGKVMGRRRARGGVVEGFAEDLNNAEAPILPPVSKPLDPEASCNDGSAKRGGRPRGSRGRGKNRGRDVGRGGGCAETSTLPRLVDQSLMHNGPQLNKGNRPIAPKAMGGLTGGAVEAVAEDPILPQVLDKSQVRDGSQLGIKTRQSAPLAMENHLQTTEGVARGFCGTPLPPPALDKSQVHDGSQLGIKSRKSVHWAMESHLQTTEGVSRGFHGSSISSPALDKSRMYDSSQLGVKTRQSATEGVVRGSAETRTLPPTVDKSRKSDSSKLGKRKRGSDSQIIGSRTTEGDTESSAKSPILPPTVDKPRLPNASQLGKRKRESDSEAVGSHLRTAEGAVEGSAEVSAEGSKDAETPLRSSSGADSRSDASHLDSLPVLSPQPVNSNKRSLRPVQLFSNHNLIVPIDTMARKIKSENLDEGDGSYRSRASSPTTPKRTTRSSSKRPSDVAKLSERSPGSNKKQRKSVKPIPIQDDEDEDNESDDHGDTTGEHTEGAEDDDETMVEKQLVSVQKEQQRKANMLRNEELTRKQEDNRRRERERQLRMKEHRDELRRQEQQRQEQERQEQERQEQARQEQGRREKERQKQERQEQERKKGLFQQQESIAMMHRVKQQMDQARLAKERKEAREERDRRLAEEQEAQEQDAAAAKRLRGEEEESDDDYEDGDDEDESEEEGLKAGVKKTKSEEEIEDESEDDEDEDEDSEEEGQKPNEEDAKAEENRDGDSDEDSYDDEDGAYDEKEEKIDKNPVLGANVPKLAKPLVAGDGCACLRCLKNLAVSPVFSCDFTDNPLKCKRCSSLGGGCIPVPASVLDAARKLSMLQKFHDAADPKTREAIRIRVKADADAISDKIRLEETNRRQTRDDRYRAILVGQVGIKNKQDEILKLLRASLSSRQADGTGSVVPGRVGKGKKGAHKRAQKRAKKRS